MKELKYYTDEELREELKRRTIEKRRNTPMKIEYVEFEATIDKIDGFRPNYIGTRFMKPFLLWTYSVKDCTLDLANRFLWRQYKVKQGCFNKSNHPKIGDRVKIRYRKTKRTHEGLHLNNAKIVEIVRRKEE